MAEILGQEGLFLIILDAEYYHTGIGYPTKK